MIRWLNPVYGLSIAWLVLSTIAFGPAGWQAVLLVAALKTAPLAVFLPALLQRQANPLMVLSLVLLFYMGYAAMLCFKPGAEGYSGMVGTALLTALLVISQLEVKRQGKQRKAAAS